MHLGKITFLCSRYAEPETHIDYYRLRPGRWFGHSGRHTYHFGTGRLCRLCHHFPDGAEHPGHTGVPRLACKRSAGTGRGHHERCRARDGEDWYDPYTRDATSNHRPSTEIPPTPCHLRPTDELGPRRTAYTCFPGRRD